MNNLYQISKLLSKQDFEKIEKALKNSWSKETTFPDTKDKWSEENKAFGQCVPTALVIYDLFGGRMIYDKANFHIWNELPDGTQQDFSREQFIDEREFNIYKYKNKEDILYDETGKRTQILRRFQIFKKKFDKALETS